MVLGGPSGGDLNFLRIPTGYCAHYFGNVGNARQLRFAPSGELFVASPTTATTGGGPGGHSAIVIFSDDNRDGVGEAPITFLSGLPSTQGMLFANDGYFYYQDGTRIMRVPYQPGGRRPLAAGAEVVNITVYISSTHWPKTLDQADDGTIYVGNGGDEGEPCDPALPFHGGIMKLVGTEVTPVSRGFRNPIAVRCERGHNLCFALELSEDFSSAAGGREKMVPIREGDDWGHPCCFTRGVPFPNLTAQPNCVGVQPEDVSFVIGHTPFGLDFERGKWPAPYTSSVFIALHGAAGTWEGQRVVAIAIDRSTGLPMPGSDLDAGSPGALSDFATGWDDGMRLHGRPAAIEFAADGRLFIGNDNNGDIIWIAPLDLER
jgi:glucose/arabinose dehydrogenase